MVKKSYGVIVGRFQVHKLHAGHKKLIRTVKNKHNNVVIFLGCTKTPPNRHNPLDFDTRKAMLLAAYPKDITVLPLQDKKTDEEWSRELDDRIADIMNLGDVTLYGSRDSFVPHYSGRHKVVELELTVPKSISSTLSREQVTNEVIQSPQFRAGMIYAAGLHYPRCFPTVDIAVIHRTETEIMLMLGKRDNEPRLRFIGGFADVGDESYERTGIREVLEESNGVHVTNLHYIGSRLIDDWRYRDCEDKIKTIFYVGESMTMEGKGSDDIAEIRWLPLSELRPTDFEPEHAKLFNMLMQYLGVANYADRSGIEMSPSDPMSLPCHQPLNETSMKMINSVLKSGRK